MRLLRAKTVTFKKFDEGFYDDDGLWKDGAEIDFLVQGSLQPFEIASRRVALPEGVDATDARVFFTKDTILTVNPLENAQAYEADIEGYRFVVTGSSPWQDTGLSLDHYEVLLVRKDKNENDDE